VNETKGTEERPAETPILERAIGIHIGTLYGGGRIAVFPGRVLVTIGNITRRVGGGEGLIHTTPEVVMIKPRIGIPWLNTGFVFHDDARMIVASTPVTARRSVAAALRLAGFHVRERRTWISLEPTASERSSSDDARLHSQARLARVISAASVALFFVALLLQRSSALTIARFLTFLSAQSVTAEFVIARSIPLTRSRTRHRALLVVNVICLVLLSSAAALLTVSWLM
jgi:hypothetical protein